MAQTKDVKALLAKFDEPWQAVLLLPDEYKDYRYLITDFSEVTFNVPQLVGGVISGWSFGFINCKPRLSIDLTDGNGYLIKASLFGDTKSLQEKLENGLKQLALSGELVCINERAYLNSAKVVDDADIGRLIPIYKPFKKTSGKSLVKLMPDVYKLQIVEAVKRLRLEYQDVPHIRQRLNLRHETLESVLAYLHCQREITDDSQTFQSTVFRFKKAIEYIAAICCVKELRRMSAKALDGFCLQSARMTPSISPTEIVQRLPFTPTDEQATAIGSYFDHFASGKRLHGLAFGDVGTGKTCLAVTAMAFVALSGHRAIMMLPNGTLAKQVHAEYSASYGDVAPAKLLTSDAQETVSDNDLVLIGTTKLLFADLGNVVTKLLVLDEIQKFSTEQKRQLVPDGQAHIIEMSATPAPRTMLHCIHELFHITTLTRSHVEKHINTAIVEDDDTEMREILTALEYGQCLIVCPQKEGSDSELTSVEEEFTRLRGQLPWATIELMHSGRTDEENAVAIARMKDGSSHVLVASSIVEVGITLPYLLCVVVKNAERFGLQTLHQVRGRLCRVYGGYGKCLLSIRKRLKPESMARLQALVQIDNGFDLSNEDMRLRGVGDISAVGVRQHGPGRLFPSLTIDVGLIEELAATIV